MFADTLSSLWHKCDIWLVEGGSRSTQLLPECRWNSFTGIKGRWKEEDENVAHPLAHASRFSFYLGAYVIGASLRECMIDNNLLNQREKDFYTIPPSHGETEIVAFCTIRLEVATAPTHVRRMIRVH